MLARQFHLSHVFDFVVASLSLATTLLSENIPTQIPNFPVVEVEGQAVTVSNLSVKFGMNFKGQMAAVVLFNIVSGNGNALREGWTQVGFLIALTSPYSLACLARYSTCFKTCSCIRFFLLACSKWKISLEVSR
jgi:Sec7-like guanine-nucleotide exchange factor